MDQLPMPAPPLVRRPDGTYAYATDADLTPYQAPAPLVAPSGPQIVHQHIHQAPPDRTVQRVALGSGIGAGAVGASVYFGPMLIAAITSMAVSLAVVALVVVVTGWAVVNVVRSVGGTDGKAAAKTLRKR
ncbi:DUF6251 family protein [Streptomyces niveus]|uniref:DUF6251 family protein n=1 Tax=Streptomyces niveus TaxID=193462 RepID=UPI0036981068